MLCNAAKAQPFFEVSFGNDPTQNRTKTQVDLAVLGGEAVESMFESANPVKSKLGYTLFTQDEWLLGCISARVDHSNTQSRTYDLYRNLLDVSSNHRLCRIWNYVPHINDAATSGVETYREFSSGRSKAFEAQFGTAFAQMLPAASAVGSDGDELVVVFAAHGAEIHHYENPLQIPAYRYPAEHGPRAPSFSRATTVGRPDGLCDVFVSGTSAIRGHATVAPGQTLEQLQCTLENLRVIGETSGIGDDLAAGKACRRFFKVYLRHPENFREVSSEIERVLLNPGDSVTYLKSDICRAALNVEIEASVFGIQMGSS